MEFQRPDEESSGLGCALLFFGGLIPALLYSSSTSNRVQCGKCHYIFGRPGLPSSQMANSGCAIVLCILLLIILPTLYASMFSEVDNSGTISTLVRAVVKFLREGSTILAFLFIGVIVLTFVLGLRLWIVEGKRQRKMLAKNFRIHPE